MQRFKPISGIQNSLPLLRQLLQDSSQVRQQQQRGSTLYTCILRQLSSVAQGDEIKELLRLADDAGAKTVKVCLDCRSYPRGARNHPPGLLQHQSALILLRRYKLAHTLH